jgi:hypothetical protein
MISALKRIWPVREYESDYLHDLDAPSFALGK